MNNNNFGNSESEPNQFSGTRNRQNSNKNFNNNNQYNENSFSNQYSSHTRQDSGSATTSPTSRTNTFDTSPNLKEQKSYPDEDDFTYSTSTLNNMYQSEQPHTKSHRVNPQDYYELSSYSNQRAVENINEDTYNPNVYSSERLHLPPHVTVSATGGTVQEIPYYTQRDSYLLEGNNNSYGNSSYNSHYEEDLMHPNSRSHLDPNATQYARPTNPYVTPSAAIYDPQPLIPPSSLKKNWWRYPYFTFLVTAIQVCVFAYQLYNNYTFTGNPIATSPLNIMIGPSSSVLIHQGARFVPCMRPGFTEAVTCLNNNNALDMTTCPVTQVCGFESFSQGQPNQWFRFITPIFLHAGVLHLLFNLFSQLTLGGHLEKYWGPFRIVFIYMLGGIGGFMFGGIYGIPRLPSVGASGAIFGLVGCELVDLIQNWKFIASPGCQLFKLLLTVAINFALGLLPFIDNFSHIGGFIIGVLASILIIPLPPKCTKKYIYIKWVAMAISLGILIYLFYFGVTGFYDGTAKQSCTWCRYLNCLPAFEVCREFNN